MVSTNEYNPSIENNRQLNDCYRRLNKTFEELSLLYKAQR